MRRSGPCPFSDAWRRLEASTSLDKAAPTTTKRARLSIPSGRTARQDRDEVLVKWVAITSRWRTPRSGQCWTGEEDKVAMREIVFAMKATATLAKSASSIGRLARWHCFLLNARATLPPNEHTLYTYMERMRLCGAPASRGTLSLRVNNSAKRMLYTQSLTVKAPPIPADTVLAPEEYVVHGTEVWRRILAGFLLFCTYSRMRCSEAASLQSEPVSEEAEDGAAFWRPLLRTRRERQLSTKATTRRARCGTWMSARRRWPWQAGVNFVCVYPPQLTTLSWMAKASGPWTTAACWEATRTQPTRCSFQYSRGAFAGPLLPLEHVVVDAIRDVGLLPNQTRSGRWVPHFGMWRISGRGRAWPKCFCM